MIFPTAFSPGKHLLCQEWAAIICSAKSGQPQSFMIQRVSTNQQWPHNHPNNISLLTKIHTIIENLPLTHPQIPFLEKYSLPSARSFHSIDRSDYSPLLFEEKKFKTHISPWHFSFLA
jgi:hypothetical protein